MHKCKRGGIGGGWKMQEKVKKKSCYLRPM